MSGDEKQVYLFKNFLLDEKESRLSEHGRTIPLTPKALEVLTVLVRNAGHLVEKDELIKTVWPDSFVEEANLARIIHTLRRTLSDDGNGNKFIETVAKKGYRFVAEVTDTSEQTPGSPSRELIDGQERRFPEDETHRSLPGIYNSKRTVFLVSLVLISLVGAAWFANNSLSRFPYVKRFLPETLNGEAYNNYKEGRRLVERRYPGDYPKALEHFERAIELDPNYVNAYAGKADAKIVEFWGPHTHDPISTARTAIRKALEIDPANSYAHTMQCRILTTYDWEHVQAEKECRRAVELDPNDHEAYRELAFLLRSLGKEDESLATMNKAIELTPTSFNKRSLGLILYNFRRYDEAIASFEQVVETDPAYKEATRWLIRCYEMKKDYPQALKYYLRLNTMSQGPSEQIAAIQVAYDKSGWPGVLKTMVGHPDLRTMFLAGTYAQLGNNDKAFEVLHKMQTDRAILLITINQEPALEPIRQDPRFADILRTMNLAEISAN